MKRAPTTLHPEWERRGKPFHSNLISGEEGGSHREESRSPFDAKGGQNGDVCWIQIKTKVRSIACFLEINS